MLIVFTGGARSGKSRAARAAAATRGQPVVVVATAEALDDEMAARIERHRGERPASWSVVEEPVEVPAAVKGAPEAATVVVDCLALWVTNLLGESDEAILARSEALLAAAAERSGSTLLVTNEVGSGVVPPTPLGRRFRDLLGEVNQTVVARADRAMLCVAGRVLELDDPGAIDV